MASARSSGKDLLQKMDLHKIFCQSDKDLYRIMQGPLREEFISI